MHRQIHRIRSLFTTLAFMASISCMQAEKVSLDTSGAQGLLLGSLSLDLGLFGGGSGEGGGAIAVQVQGYVPVPTKPLEFTLATGSGDQSLEFTGDGTVSFPEPLNPGEAYSVTLNSSYTGGQTCAFTSGKNGIMGNSNLTVSVVCRRHSLAILHYNTGYNETLAFGRFDPVNYHVDSPAGYSPWEAGGTNYSPSLRWNGNQYLVAYAISGNLEARFLSIELTTLASLTVTTTTADAITSSAIAYSSGLNQYLVAWTEVTGSDWSLKIRYLNPDGTAAGPVATLTTSANGRIDDVAIASTSSHFLIAYHYRNSLGTTSVQISSLTPGSVSGSFTFSYSCNGVNEYRCEHPSLATGGSGALLVWGISSDDSGDYYGTIKAQPLTAAGSASGSSYIVYNQQASEVCGAEEASDQGARPSIANNGLQYLVVWDYVCGDVSTVYSLVHARVVTASAPVGSVIDMGENFSPNRNWGSSVRWNGTHYEVLFANSDDSIIVLNYLGADGYSESDYTLLSTGVVSVEAFQTE